MFHFDSLIHQSARSFHWSAASQRRVKEMLSETGSVQLAFDTVSDRVARTALRGELLDILRRSGGPELQPFMCNLAQNSAVSESGQNLIDQASYS
jgi:hypothetical protein